MYNIEQYNPREFPILRSFVVARTSIKRLFNQTSAYIWTYRAFQHHSKTHSLEKNFGDALAILLTQKLNFVIIQKISISN